MNSMLPVSSFLPGASSALYGANAFNGILFMNSKSPFTYQGISTYFKYGKTTRMQPEQMIIGISELGPHMLLAPHFAAKSQFYLLECYRMDCADEDYDSVTT